MDGLFRLLLVLLYTTALCGGGCSLAFGRTRGLKIMGAIIIIVSVVLMVLMCFLSISNLQCAKYPFFQS